MKTLLLRRRCGGLLIRQHSGRRSLWVCQKNKRHKFIVGSNLRQPYEEMEEEKKK